MTKIDCWGKAEAHLAELYGDNSRIAKRFLTEKRWLEKFGAAEYFDRLATLCRESLEKNGKKLIATFPVPYCLTAYLLGASDINPLPPHYYCPKCKRVEWAEASEFLFDMCRARTCECGAEMYADGYDLSWRIYLPYAERIHAKTPLPEHCDGLNEALIKEHFQHMLLDAAQVCQRLGEQTGVRPEEIELCDGEVKRRLLEGGFDCASPGMAKFLSETYNVVKPNDYSELLTLIGVSYGTHTWRENAEELLQNGKCRLSDIPATRDEVLISILDALRKQNVDDADFAMEVAEKARYGYYGEHGMDSHTEEKLRELGLDEWFITYVSRTLYMSTKTLSILYLKHIVMLTWYQSHYPKQYAETVGKIKVWQKK